MYMYLIRSAGVESVTLAWLLRRIFLTCNVMDIHVPTNCSLFPVKDMQKYVDTFSQYKNRKGETK